MEGDISVVVPHQNLGDLCRRHRHLLDQRLDLWIGGMVVDGMVVVGKDPESLRGAVPHVYVHVHPARPQEGRVETLLVVGCEDDDPFLPTRRPQAINKIEQP
uniref:Uncharacterized protein n=1 Tax=Triticum urartu TaxID=4572 RepID=A0A8R7TB19_TRIUA